MSRYALGLHTKMERTKAYAKAKYEYERALKEIEKHGLTYPGYALGYITATLDIARAEEEPDQEFMRILGGWIERLIQASGIGQNT